MIYLIVSILEEIARKDLVETKLYFHNNLNAFTNKSQKFTLNFKQLREPEEFRHYYNVMIHFLHNMCIAS